MPSTGLTGPYRLDSITISNTVTRTSPGAYALGTVRDGTFYISYVGRSDADVASRLADHVGKYTHFKFGYFPTAKAAFEKECRMWHDFGGDRGELDNAIHPDRPDGTTWRCPACGHYDRPSLRW